MSTLATQLKKMYWQQNSKPKMPTEGLVFYAPITSTMAPEIGTLKTQSYTDSFWTFGKLHNVPSASRLSNGWNNVQYNSTSTYSSLSFWLFTQARGDALARPDRCGCGTDYGDIVSPKGLYRGRSLVTPFNLPKQGWNHYFIAFGTSCLIYVNAIKEIDTSWSNSGTLVYLNQDGINNVPYAWGAVRAYNRALLDSEIQQLAHEFTPTT